MNLFTKHFFTFVIFLSSYSAIHGDMWKAIKDADFEAFKAELHAGFDPYELNPETNVPVSFEIVDRLVDAAITIDAQKSGFFVGSLLSGYFGGVGAAFLTTVRYNKPLTGVACGILAGVGIGVGTYKLLEKLFMKKDAIKNYTSMFMYLLNHPLFNKYQQHPITGKTIIDVVTDALDPDYQTQTYVTYDYIHQPVWYTNNSPVVSIPIANPHTYIAATFLVHDKPYSLESTSYAKLIKPVLEKLFIALQNV